MTLKPLLSTFPVEYIGKWCITQHVGTHASFDQMYVETISGYPTIRLFDSEDEAAEHLKNKLKINNSNFSVMQIKEIDSEEKSIYPEPPCCFVGLNEK